MKTVRSSFAAAAAVLGLLVFIGGFCRSAVGVVTATATVVECCDNSSDGGRPCRNGNRTFQAIEAIGGGRCDENAAATPVRKCCPPDQAYDPLVRFCRTTADTDRHTFRRLLLLDRLLPDTRITVGYDYDPPKCNGNDVLVDVPADEVRQLLNATELVDSPVPGGYCFDSMTVVNASAALVARACRPRERYCRGRYTCVNKCCKGDRMIVGK